MQKVHFKPIKMHSESDIQFHRFSLLFYKCKENTAKYGRSEGMKCITFNSRITSIIATLLMALAIVSASAVKGSAITPASKVNLDKTEITSYDITNVVITGTLTRCHGQDIVLRKNGTEVAKTKVGTSTGTEKFSIRVPSNYLKYGETSQFDVQAANKLGVVNASYVKNVTVKCVRKEVPISKVSFPASVNMTVGESKTISVSTTPSNATYKTNIEWGCQSNGVISYKTNGYGTYWKQASSETIKALKAGKAYLFITVKVYDSNGKYVTKYNFNTTVTVAANKKSTGSSSSSKTKKNIPLKSIKLNKTSVSLKEGESLKLSVSYNPTNTTAGKSVTWKSSKTSVATVSGGKITAKKAGTATITAKVGSKTATCKVSVQKPQKAAPKNSTTKSKSGSNSGATSKETYKNVSDAYSVLNTFRTTKSNQWYWNQNNTSKITVYGLKSLKRDVTLENVAKTRAKEQWASVYVNGKGTHTRPNGKDCWSAYPSGSRPCGENLAWGQTSSKQVISDASGWAETNKPYSEQGHRRNMLSPSATRVGIACYMKNGKTCWAMCLGY